MIRILAVTAALLVSTSVYAQTDTTTTTTTVKTTKHHMHKHAPKMSSDAAMDAAATRPHAAGPQERALDAGQEPSTKPDPQAAETRRLNGGM